MTERLAEPNTDIASIQFAVDDTATFELRTNKIRNITTCQQCVMIVQDPGRPTEKKFIPHSGTITPSSADNPKEGKYTVTLSNVTLEEVTIRPTVDPEVVSGGSCLNLQNTAFDTANKCVSMKDCANKKCVTSAHVHAKSSNARMHLR